MTIHRLTAGSWKPRSNAIDTMAANSNTSSTVSCHTTRKTWVKLAGSAHFGVRRKGLFDVINPVHTALPTEWVSAIPATAAVTAPRKPEPTLGG